MRIKKLDWELCTPPFSLLISLFPHLSCTLLSFPSPLREPSPFRPLIFNDLLPDLHSSLTVATRSRSSMPKEKATTEKPERKSTFLCLVKMSTVCSVICSTVLRRWWTQEAQRVQQIYADRNGTFEGERTTDVTSRQVS